LRRWIHTRSHRIVLIPSSLRPVAYSMTLPIQRVQGMLLSRFTTTQHLQACPPSRKRKLCPSEPLRYWLASSNQLDGIAKAYHPNMLRDASQYIGRIGSCSFSIPMYLDASCACQCHTSWLKLLPRPMRLPRPLYSEKVDDASGFYRRSQQDRQCSIGLHRACRR